MVKLNPSFSESNSGRDSRDVDAENAADHAYSAAGWLKFMGLSEDRSERLKDQRVLFGKHHIDDAWSDERRPDQLVLVGGGYADEVFGHFGYHSETTIDGTVLARRDPLFTSPKDMYYVYDRLYRVLNGVPTKEDRLYSELDSLNETYTSLSVRERVRLVSNDPVDVPKSPDNVIWHYYCSPECVVGLIGYNEAFLDENTTLEAKDGSQLVIRHDLQAGTRLIIDDIPRDDMPIETDACSSHTQVQVYRNSEGYLIADKVVDGRIVTKQQIKAQAEDGHVNVDDSDSQPDLVDDIYSHNGRKQFARDFSTGDYNGIQLLTTTAKYGNDGPGLFYMEITVKTPDDSGNEVQVIFSNGNAREEPISLRVVPDNEASIVSEV